MKVLNKFTLKNLKLNKKRTIVTMIGIILSTALICAVAGMVTSFRQTLINVVKETKGNYHTTFSNVEQDKLKYIRNNENIKNYFLTSDIGWADLEGSKNEEKPYVHIFSYDIQALKNYAVNVIDGRFPENSNEIIISEHINTNGRVGLKIGDKITLNVGKRVLQDGTKLNNENPYLTGVEDNGIIQQESIKSTEIQEYIIVGIMKRPNYEIENYSSPGYTIITYQEKDAAISKVGIEYKKPENYEKYNEEIISAIYEKIVNEDIVVNSELLRYQGIMGEALTRTLYTLGAIVISIIIVTSIFVIRNSFSISVAEKNRQYGMMSSVGATAKQIKKSVLFEGLIVGVIAVPIGILCGMLAVVILIAIMNNLLGNMLNGLYFVYSVPVLPILLTILLSAITIYLSCIIPARRASKISPVESIRGNNDIKIKGKKLKTSKLIKKLFGIGGVISSKNLKRCRKKYRTTVISIVLSVFIFISLNSFMGYGNKISSVYYSEMNFNIMVTGGEKSLYENIAKDPSVEKFAYFKQSSMGINEDKYGTEIGKKINNNKSEANVTLIVYNNQYFKEYLKKIGISESKYAEGGILIDEFKYTDDETKKQSLENIYNIKDGQSFEARFDNKTTSITNLKRTDERPMGQESNYYTSGSMIISEAFLQALKDRGIKPFESESMSLCMQSADSSTLENRLNDLRKENTDYTNIEVTNLDTIAKNENRMYLIIAIFLYGFITVISLIGVTNIFNTVTTNMILRSKEFAMLKSIGMTTKEFNRMIRLESLLYGLKSLIIGIPLGLAGSYAIYLAFKEQLDMGYILPLTAIILSILFVFIIVGATMKYSLNKINKQNIIETIRKDNI